MKIVFLDAKTIGDDIDLSAFEKLGEVVTYNFSTTEEALERTVDADVIVLNKVEINEHSIGKAKKLKLVCVTATGTNNLDKEYLKSRGIEWRNVAGYSTESVAQHTFAMLFYLWEKLAYYDQYVKSEKYVGDVMFTHFEKRFHELSGKTWGIIGLGNIGRRVADIAKAFGCRVIYYSTSGKNFQQGYERVEFDALLEQSDIVSVHAPLDKNTRGLMNREAFRKMKSSAVFLNLGRGPIVVEQDLADALETGEIAGAGLDVLSAEPMRKDNPLRKIKDSERLIITPHIGWASVEARTRLMEIICQQIADFQNQIILSSYVSYIIGRNSFIHHKADHSETKDYRTRIESVRFLFAGNQSAADVRNQPDVYDKFSQPVHRAPEKRHWKTPLSMDESRCDV